MIATAPSRKTTASSGFILVLVIAISFVLTLLTVSMLSIASAKYSKTKADINDAAAIYAAEAGISDTVVQLNKNPSFSGYSSEKTFYSNARQGKATYTTTVSTTGSMVTVVSTGFLYRHAADTTSFTQKGLKVILNANKQPSLTTSSPDQVVLSSWQMPARPLPHQQQLAQSIRVAKSG